MCLAPPRLSALSALLDECGEIFRLGWPIAITRIAQFVPKMLMLGVVARLPGGATYLAGAGTGTMFCNVSGQAFISGTGYGGTALMSHAYGAGNLPRVGLLLQRQLAMHGLLVVCFVAPLWLCAEPLLIALHQPAQTAALAARFALIRLFAMPFNTIFTDLSSFLTAQKVTKLPAAINAVSSTAQALLFLLLVRAPGTDALALGFDGAAIALSVGEIAQALALLALTPRALSGSVAHAGAWPRWTSWRPALRGWGEMLSLGLPSAVMTMAEWLGWECSLFQAGALCEGEVACAALEAFPVLSQTMVVLFMLHFGFAIAAGARVGNALGAGRPKEAILTARAGFAIALAIGTAVSIGLVAGRNAWARLFVGDSGASDSELANLIADALPLVAGYVLLDALGPAWAHQILFAAGRVRFGAAYNVLCFWVFAQPLGAALAFRYGLGIFGLWAGLDAGMAALVLGLVAYVATGLDWAEASKSARKRSLRAASSEGETGLKRADAASDPLASGGKLLHGLELNSSDPSSDV